MRAFFPRLGASVLLALSLGCARTPGIAGTEAGAIRTEAGATPAANPRVGAASVPASAPAYALDLKIGTAPVPATPQPTGLEPILALGGGLVDVQDWASETEPTGYGTQLVPADTNLEAQHDAELWAPDAKQMYVAAGFWRTPFFGLTKHVFYSPSRDQKYILYFKLFKGIVKRKIVKASPQYQLAYKIMRGAQDAWSYDLRAAHKRARDAYYRPTGSITVGVLIHPLVIGPCWVFLDNPEDQRPVLAVRARDGGTYREGDLPFEAIKVLVTRSEDEDLFGPVSASSASSW